MKKRMWCFYWMCSWGIFCILTTTTSVCSEIVPSPIFMQRLLDEADRTMEASTRINETTMAFQVLARSLLPLSSHHVEDGKVLVVHFRLPEEHWTSVQACQWWVALGIVGQLGGTYSGSEVKIIFANSTSNNTWPNMIQTIRNNQRFVYFNVTSWYLVADHGRNFELRVSVCGRSGNQMPVNNVIIASGVEYGPLMVFAPSNLMERVELSKPSSRQRREDQNMLENIFYRFSPCHLETWTVSTDDLRWDWLVYPHRLALNACIGLCPLPYVDSNLNASNHALARNIYRSLNNSEHTARQPEVQCVPISYKMMSLLLHTEPGNFTIAISNDLLASSCGCR